MTSSRLVSERAFILQYARAIKYRCAIAAARLLHNGARYRVKGDEIHRAQLLARTADTRTISRCRKEKKGCLLARNEIPIIKWNSSRDKWHNHRYRTQNSPFEIGIVAAITPANCIKHAVCSTVITRLRFADPICRLPYDPFVPRNCPTAMRAR